jgi:hypothetical protein
MREAIWSLTSSNETSTLNAADRAFADGAIRSGTIKVIIPASLAASTPASESSTATQR